MNIFKSNYNIKHSGIILLALFMMTSGIATLGAQDALAMYRQKRYTEAIAITLREIERDRFNMDAYSVLGWSLNLLKRHQEAIDYAKRARAVNTSDHRIAGILAEAYLGAGQDALALENYSIFVNMGQQIPSWDPRNLRDAYRDMGDIYMKLKEFHRADIAYTTAIGFDRGRSAFDSAKAAQLWVLAARARESLKDNARAASAYQQALARDSTNNDASVGLARTRTP